MAAVVKVIREKSNPHAAGTIGNSKYEEVIKHSSQLTMPLLTGSSESSDNFVHVDKLFRHAGDQPCQENGTATNGVHHFPDYDEDEEVIGIITLEDVFEELLQVPSTISSCMSLS